MAGLGRTCSAFVIVPTTTSAAALGCFLQPLGLPACLGAPRRPTIAWQRLDLQTTADASSPFSTQYSAGTRRRAQECGIRWEQECNCVVEHPTRWAAAVCRASLIVFSYGPRLSPTHVRNTIKCFYTGPLYGPRVSPTHM